MKYKQINYSFKFVQDCLKGHKWKALGDYFKETFRISFDETGQPHVFAFCNEVVESFIEVLVGILEVSEKDSSVQYLLEESLKALRNYTVNEETRLYLVKEKSVQILQLYVSRACSANSPELYHRFLWQLLLNVLTLNEETVKNLYEQLFDKIVVYFMKHNSYSYETSALIYNFMRNQHLENESVIHKVIDLYTSQEKTNEYLLFLMEKIISEEILWASYEKYNVLERTTVLSVLRECLLNRTITLSQLCINCLVKLFLDSSNIVFQVTQTETPDAAYEAALIVEILASISSEENYLLSLQSNKDILISTGVLLINVHKLGKICDNSFTPIQKLNEVGSPGEEIRQNPVFGFKADLVRLVGNLCWKNKNMQELARKAELIPVLLDCCNIDGRNPFIMQWVILAIRNLCEKNTENQKMIASLHQEGTVSSSVLEELGITLNAEGETSLKIVPLT